jgi:hypothetical protein
MLVERDHLQLRSPVAADRLLGDRTPRASSQKEAEETVVDDLLEALGNAFYQVVEMSIEMNSTLSSLINFNNRWSELLPEFAVEVLSQA